MNEISITKLLNVVYPTCKFKFHDYIHQITACNIISCRQLLTLTYKILTIILLVNKGENQLDATNSDLLVIGFSSTCFGHLYAHHQEVGLCFTAYDFCPVVAVVMLESRVAPKSPASQQLQQDRNQRQ